MATTIQKQVKLLIQHNSEFLSDLENIVLPGKHHTTHAHYILQKTIFLKIKD